MYLNTERSVILQSLSMRIALTSIFLFHTMFCLSQTNAVTLERHQWHVGGGITYNHIPEGKCNGITTVITPSSTNLFDRFCHHSFWTWHTLVDYTFTPTERLSFHGGLEYHRRGYELELDPDTFALYGQPTAFPFLRVNKREHFFEIPLVISYNTSNNSSVGFGFKFPFYIKDVNKTFYLDGEVSRELQSTGGLGHPFDYPYNPRPFLVLRQGLLKEKTNILNFYVRIEAPEFWVFRTGDYWNFNGGVEFNIGRFFD